jgi:hypothetical protein
LCIKRAYRMRAGTLLGLKLCSVENHIHSLVLL